jgi:uncharacterized lipoprotein YmbA
MMRLVSAMTSALSAAGLALGCAALSSQPDLTRYYVLTPIAVPPAMSGGFDRSVGVGPVKVPDHLEDRLVTRLADEEVAISDTQRWSEPLHEAVRGVVRQDLIALLGTRRIVAFPWDPKAPPDLAVTLEIVQFERTSNGTADVKARWSIEQGSNRAPLLMKESSFSKPIVGTDSRAAVAALSAALNNLTQQIAMDIRHAGSLVARTGG